MSAVPSAARIACGVSTWISKWSVSAASEPDSSTFPSANTNASTCSTEVTLGSVTTNPSVRPSGFHQRAHEQLQRAYTATARRRLEALHPDSVERRRVAGRDRRRERPGGRDRCRVLVLVVPDAVAVLEVDAEVLDRLGVQLAAYPLVDLDRDAGPQVHRFGQLRHGPGVSGECTLRLLGPAADRAGVVAVGGDVDRVHRLATPTVAGVRRGQGCVGIREACVELIREGVAVVGHDFATSLYSLFSYRGDIICKAEKLNPC